MVAKAQKVLDYEFKTPELLWEGLQAPGSNVTSLNGRDIPGGNKPLAGVGDKVFALVTVLDSYERGTTANLLRAMVSNYQLATAVIGAAYRDGGLDAARQVMKKLKLLKES
ncbi:ribonuclease III domain-containing protein [Biscogniauxia sp. FL1348]|nr:ribonuclease III domain-containing protein [Biscogniauxia sp. FL1348]